MRILDEIIRPDSELVMLLNSLYDGVYIVDPQRRILFWNKAAEAMTGYSAEEVMGRSCADSILNHIDENGTLLCHSYCPILRALDSVCNQSAKVYPLTRWGHRFPVETHVSCILDDSGKPIAAIEVFRDITHQEEYRVMQEKFNTLIRKYVSTTTFEEVQERSRAGASALESRVIDLTVMYLDVVSFTRFSENNSTEAVVEMLNELFGVCDVITRECFGDIDKFIGDAVMAVFHDANDAVRSAMRILGYALPKMNESRVERGLTPISIRIGINSGMVVQGEVGTIDRKDLTVIGDAVNTAARIEKSAPHNHLLISETTHTRLSDEYRARFSYHHSEELRGKSEAIRLFILES